MTQEATSTAVETLTATGLQRTSQATSGTTSARRSRAATDAWVGSVPELPALSGSARTAERLLLLVHYGIDWSGSWVGRYRTSYWSDVLPSRVLKATYRSNTLSAWWSQITVDLGSAPRTAAERHEAVLLQSEAAKPVLAVLREQTPALLLRVRLVADAVRDQSDQRQTGTEA